MSFDEVVILTRLPLGIFTEESGAQRIKIGLLLPGFNEEFGQALRHIGMVGLKDYTGIELLLLITAQFFML